MKQKPFSIKFFALCFLLAPFINLFISGWVNQWPLTGPRGVLEHLSIYERVVLCLFIVVAIGIWKVVKWGYYLFISFSVLIIVHNFYVLVESQAYSRYLVLLFQVTTLCVVGFFLQKHITAPYFNPKLKWWESLPRYKTNIKGRITFDNKNEDIEILDISRGGCFIKTDFKLQKQNEFNINFDYRKTEFTGRGKVTWLSDKIQNGYGVKFTQTGVKERWILQSIIKNLRSRKYIQHSEVA